MSTPHIAWAFAQRDLTAAQRVVLIALAERANGERTCFPSEQRLADDCELSRRSVIAAVQYLHTERGLIEVVTDPVERAAILAKAGANHKARVNVYRILRPAEGEKSAHPTNGSAKSAHNHSEREKSAHQSPDDSAKSAHLTAVEGEKSSSSVCKKRTIEGAPFAHEPLNESLNEKKKGSEGFKNSEPQGGTPPPAPPLPRAAQRGTTDGSSVERQPGEAVYGTPEEARATYAFLSGLQRDRDAAKPAPPDRRANPIAVKRAVGATIYQLRKYAPAPGVAAERSRSDQIDEVLHGEVLAPIRRGPVEAERTPEQQYAELMGISLAEAARAFGHTIEANA